ncbi:MAG: 1-phosphofructokinase [Erysipelotrichales bacterium]|nr:1-phosphofructokinase [Erysipelotrichales bacterium]
MIYTITLNPALDYVVKVDEFREGKTNRSKEEMIYYGGKGINVSYVLKELGLTSKCLGFVAGFTGKELVRGINKQGLVSDFIQVNEGMTRINVKLKSEVETEINGMGPIISKENEEELLNQLDNLIKGDLLVLSGSIPTTMDANIYTKIIQRVSNKEIEVIIDTAGNQLLNVLEYKPLLIKPNNDELASLFKVDIQSLSDVEYYARKLQDMGARNVLVSMADKGSLLVDEEGNVHHQGVCKGVLKNSVGAGDSMVAGFISGYLRDYNYDDILALATACGGATAFSEGLANKEMIDACLAELKENLYEK